MKTQEQKLQHVMEAAGECWHVASEDRKVFEDSTGKFRIRYCTNCGESWDKCVDKNPSPDDLNELFRLAEKLGWTDVVTGETPDGGYFADIINSDTGVMLGGVRSEALLNALFIATGGKE